MSNPFKFCGRQKDIKIKQSKCLEMFIKNLRAPLKMKFNIGRTRLIESHLLDVLEDESDINVNWVFCILNFMIDMLIKYVIPNQEP